MSEHRGGRPFAVLPVGCTRTNLQSILLRNLVDQSLGFFPAEAGVCDGFAVAAFADFLTAVFDVALDHQTANKAVKVAVVANTVKDFFADTDLLKIFFAGVGMVGIYDDAGVFESFGHINVVELYQILVVVVGATLAEVVYVTSENGMGVGITVGLYFPASVQKGVGTLGCHDAVHHDGEVAAGGVFHTDRDPDTAGCQAVLLVLYRACADSRVGQDIGDITVIFRVQHFICTGHAGFADSTGMQIPNL